MRANSWPAEAEQFVLDHYKTMGDRAMSEVMNDQLGFYRNPHAIKTWRYHRGLSVLKPGQNHKRGIGRLFDEPEEDLIAWLSATHTAADIAAILQDHGYNRTKAQITAFRKNHGFKCGLPTGSWGTVAALTKKAPNKKGESFCPEYEFKPGCSPWNKAEVGTERKNSDGYWIKKIAEPDVWTMRSRANWEAAYGPLKPTQRLIRLDRSKDNDSLDNLRVVDQGIMAKFRGDLALVPGNPELNAVIITIAEMERKLKIKHRGDEIK